MISKKLLQINIIEYWTFCKQYNFTYFKLLSPNICFMLHDFNLLYNNKSN